jgi:hypothetical protein
VRSPQGDVSVPSAIGGVVTGVVGLDDSAEFVHTNHVVDKNAPPSAGFRNAPPLSNYWAEPRLGQSDRARQSLQCVPRPARRLTEQVGGENYILPP